MSPVPVDPNTLVAGTTARAADVEAKADALFAYLNGALDNDAISASAGIEARKMATAFLEKIGVDGASTTRRGKAIIPTNEARVNPAFGLMPSPDRVSGIVLPADSLLVIGYKALWRNTVANAGRAAIFLGANQLKIARTNSAPVVQQAGGAGMDPNLWTGLGTGFLGLYTDNAIGGASSSDVTTGQVLAPGDDAGPAGFAAGGLLYVFAAAGTYDVSVQFAATSGTVEVTERKLWVWTVGF